MEAENNKAIVQRFLEGALGKGNESDTEVLATHCTLNAPGLFNGEISDEDGVRTIVGQIRKAIPDLDLTIEEQVFTKDGDVATRWKLTGTHTGPIESLEPTGASIESFGQSVSRLSDGKITEMSLSTITKAGDGTWSAMELNNDIEEVSEVETLAPDEVLYKRKPRPWYCRAFNC